MAKRIVVLTFEGLATSPLGAYGCSWLETPGFDRLAATGVVYDRLYASSTDPLVVLQRYLSIEGSPTSVAKLASLLGMATLFFTDSASAAELAEVQDFDQSTLLESEPISSAANEVEETGFGRLLAAALARQELLGDAPHLLWIHSAALVKQWDAPLDFRESDDLAAERSDEYYSESADEDEFDEDELEDESLDEEQHDEEQHDEEQFDEDQVDEEEPESAVESGLSEEVLAALHSLQPPTSPLAEGGDPDILIAWMAAYGAQVRLIDTLLDVAFAEFGKRPGEYLIVGSTGGFALGERGCLGVAAEPPKSSRLHLPLFMRTPEVGPIRSGHPILSHRLSITLADWIQDATKMSEDSLLEELQPERWAREWEATEPIYEIIDDLRQPSGALTTYRVSPGWFYISNPDGREELYLKPDDRYDINDVAKLSPNIIECFRVWQC